MSPALRILVVTSGYRSGNGNFIADQVTSLRSNGIDVDVVFVDAKKTRLNYGLSIPRIAVALRSSRYDLVHTHHSYTLIAVDIAKVLTGSRVPIVLTNHEGDVLDFGLRARTWHPTSRLRHSVRLKRLVAERSNFVIFVSRKLAETIAVNRPHEIVPCGVDMEKFRVLDRGECRRSLGLPADGTVVFFPADPRRRGKRFDLALAVFEMVRQRAPDALLLTGGRIHTDAMPLYYNASNVVLQTSSAEASPTVVKEALACEVPVVSTDAGDTREVIQGLPHCCVCSDDPREIAIRVLEANGYRAVGGRGRLLRMGLSLEQVASRVIQIYARVLGGELAAGIASP